MTREKEALRRFPTWKLQDSLVASVSSTLLIGVPSLAASPNISEVWDEPDPSKWTPDQLKAFPSAKAGVLFLHGIPALQRVAIEKIYKSHLKGVRWLIVHEGSAPASHHSRTQRNGLSDWAQRMWSLPRDSPLWQHKGKWATCTPPPATKDSSLIIWSTDGCRPIPDIPPTWVAIVPPPPLEEEGPQLPFIVAPVCPTLLLEQHQEGH